MQAWTPSEPARAWTRSSPRPSAPASRSAASAPTSGSATASARRTSRCSRRRSRVPDLTVTVAGLELENPLIAGSGEATMDANGIRAALDAGAVALTTRQQGFVPAPATRRPVLGTFAAIGGAWSLPVTLRHVAKARLRYGPDPSLIGPNGARDGHDGARFLLAGASAVQ